MYVLKNAEIRSRRSLKPNIPREPKLGVHYTVPQPENDVKMLWVGKD